MRGTRKEFVDKLADQLGVACAAMAADLAEELGGPFEPEPPKVEVVWEAGMVPCGDGDYPPIRLELPLAAGAFGGWWKWFDGIKWIDDPHQNGDQVYAELARRLLAEWRAKQGPGDAFDAAAREYFPGASRGEVGHLAATFRHKRLQTSAGPSAWIHPDSVIAITPAGGAEEGNSVVWFSGNPGDNTPAASRQFGDYCGMMMVIVLDDPDVTADRLGFDTSGILKPSLPAFDPELAEKAKQINWTPPAPQGEEDL